MIRHLRKGQSSVYLQFDGDGSTIGAKAFQAELLDNTFIIRLKLHPVDDNQTMDERALHSEQLKSVQLFDEFVISGLVSFFNARSARCSEVCLQILSKGQTFSFPINFGVVESSFMTLLISNIDDLGSAK